MLFDKKDMLRFLSCCTSIVCFTLILAGSEPYSIEPSNPLYESWRWKTYTELGDKGIRCLTEGKDHSMWFGTGKGLYHYDGLHWNNYLEVNDVLKAPIYGLCYTGRDILYVVSPKGICHFKNNTWQTDLFFPDEKVLGSAEYDRNPEWRNLGRRLLWFDPDCKGKIYHFYHTGSDPGPGRFIQGN